jgi:translocation and assembly module TamB
LAGEQPAAGNSNNIAGNIAINYQLSKDGRYALRFYRRNEYEGTLYAYEIKTGLGLIITVDYNTFRQLIHGRRERNRTAPRQDANQNQQK